jgi:hypothetical protein
MRFFNIALPGLLFLPLAGAAQCTDIFISEYVEGTGNNKAIEFYNPTGNPINLGTYVLQRWSNGEAGSTDQTALVGQIAPNSTFVLVNGQTEDIDLGGGNISPACDPALQLLGNQLDNPYPAPTYMNGDDALVLVKNNNTVVDIFGKPGEDPGVAWTDDAANGFTDGDGGTWLTSNHTLRRKYAVTGGVTLPPVAFDTFLQWDTLEVNTWSGLGAHACACNPTGVSAPRVQARPEIRVFPNPSADASLQITSSVPMERVEVYTAAGVLVQQNALSGLSWQAAWEQNIPSSGVYFVNVTLIGGTTYSHRWLIP